MAECDYIIQLDSATRLCRYRHHHVTKGKKVTEFVVQLEIFIGGEWRAVVRYDTSHGRPHQDILRPNGSQTKKWLDLSMEAALTHAHEDVMQNWRVYRDRFLKEFEK